MHKTILVHFYLAEEEFYFLPEVSSHYYVGQEYLGWENAILDLGCHLSDTLQGNCNTCLPTPVRETFGVIRLRHHNSYKQPFISDYTDAYTNSYSSEITSCKLFKKTKNYTSWVRLRLSPENERRRQSPSKERSSPCSSRVSAMAATWSPGTTPTLCSSLMNLRDKLINQILHMKLNPVFKWKYWTEHIGESKFNHIEIQLVIKI